MLSTKTIAALAGAITLVAPAAAWQATVYNNGDCSASGANYFAYWGSGSSPCITVGNDTAAGVGCGYYTNGGVSSSLCGDGGPSTPDTYATWLGEFAANKHVSIFVPSGTEITYCYTNGAFTCSVNDGNNCRNVQGDSDGTCMQLNEGGFENFNTIQMTAVDHFVQGKAKRSIEPSSKVKNGQAVEFVKAKKSVKGIAKAAVFQA